jgi:hypothetical protein
MVAAVETDVWNAAERALAAAAAAGAPCRLRNGETVRADLIRALLVGGSFAGVAVARAPRGLDLSGGAVEGELDLANAAADAPVRLRGLDLPGGVDLSRARIAHLDLTGAAVAALVATEIAVEGDVVLDRAAFAGPVRLEGASVRGRLTAYGARFERPDGVAIDAQGARFAAFLMRPDDAGQPTRIRGALNLFRAEIAGVLELRGVELAAASQVALSGVGLVASRVLIGRDSRIDGCVTFAGARIEGLLRISGLRLASAALARARAEDPLPPPDGARHEFDDSALAHVALDLSEARVGHLVLPDTPETRPRGIVDLSRARVGTFTDFAAAWPPPVERQARRCPSRACDEFARDADHLVLDGFEYEHLDNPDGAPPGQGGGPGRIAEVRRRWLHAQSRIDVFTHFRPQPWRQLAKVLAAEGYEDEAREIAIERRIALRFVDGAPAGRRVVSRLLHVLADYGFNPWKTVAWSLGLVALFALAYGAAAYGGCAERVPLCADQTAFVRVLAADYVPGVADAATAEANLRRVYPAFDPLLYSFDVFLPLLDLGADRFWRPNEHWTPAGFPLGRALQWATALQQVLGALLVSLAVTGFTGLLTREER